MEEVVLNIIKFGVPGLVGILGVWIGFRMNRNYQEKTLNRQSLRVIRPTLTNLIELCTDIQIYYKLENRTNLAISETRSRLSTNSINERFSRLIAEFEDKNNEIIDVVMPKTKQLLGRATICAISVKSTLPAKSAHPDFYTQAGPMKPLQIEVRKLLEILNSI